MRRSIISTCAWLVMGAVIAGMLLLADHVGRQERPNPWLVVLLTTLGLGVGCVGYLDSRADR